jgi:indolepyruvate ferredoxin oxidoreductase beta subunit
MREGFHVKKSEVHGMAQRGGSVVARALRRGGVLAPHSRGQADVLVGFDGAEAARLKSILKDGGADVTPALAKAGNVITSSLFINTFMLGVLSKFTPISETSWLAALHEVFAGKQEAENERVFRAARELAI